MRESVLGLVIVAVASATVSRAPNSAPWSMTRAADDQERDGTTVLVFSNGWPPAPICSDQSELSVAVAYTEAVKEKHLSISTMIANGDKALDAILAASGVNETLNMIDAGMVADPETNDTEVDFAQLLAGTRWKSLHSRPEDLVLLLTTNTDEWGWSTVGALPTARFAMVAVTNAFAPGYSMAHELGHLAGAGHEKGSGSGAPLVPYGHGYGANGKHRTIMATRAACINCPRIGRFANPTRPRLGTPTGNADSNVARVLNDAFPYLRSLSCSG